MGSTQSCEPYDDVVAPPDGPRGPVSHLLRTRSYGGRRHLGYPWLRIEIPMDLRVQTQRFAPLLLGATWIVLGGAKLLSSDRARAAEILLGLRWAEPVALVVSATEVMLGVAVLWGQHSVRRVALFASLGLLLLYGGFAVIHHPVQCTCAGRLLRLSPLAHAFVTAAMLALTAASLMEVHPANSRNPARLRTVAVGALVIVLGVGLALVTRRTPPMTAPEQRNVLPEAPLAADPERQPHLRPANPGVPPQAHPPSAQPGPSDTAVHGSVSDDSGAPIVGAQVWLAPSTMGFRKRSRLPLVTTTEGGAFHFPLTTQIPESPMLCAWAPSSEPACTALAAGFEETHIVLVRGRSVEGQVLDDAGQPVSNAVVEAIARLGEEVREDYAGVVFGPAAIPEYAMVKTGQDGRFVLCGLKRDTDYQMTASAAGYYSETRNGEAFRSTPGQEGPITLRLGRLFLLNAIAVDRSSLKPVKFVSYVLTLPGGSWLPSADSVQRAPMPYVTAASVLTEKGAWVVLRSASPDARPDPVTLVVSAQGYRKCIVDVPLHPVAESREPTQILLDPDSDEERMPVRFRAVWKSGNGFDGTLFLRVRKVGGAFTSVPVVFHGGECGERMELSAGEYEGGLLAHEGSTTFWHAPTERPTLRFAVPGVSDDTVTFLLRGGALVLAPRTEGGVALTQYKVTLSGGSTATTQDTWRFMLPLQRSDDDVSASIFFLEPGPLDVRIKKYGFLDARGFLTVPDDGGTVRWEPVLRESGR